MNLSEEAIQMLLHQACLRQRELCAKGLEYFYDRIIETPLAYPCPEQRKCQYPDCKCERTDHCE